MRARPNLVTLGIFELGLAVLAARFIGRETSYPIYLVCYLSMGIVWLFASYHVLSGKSDEPKRLASVLLFAIVMRAAFLPTPPVLSDDIFRYIWDGRVQHAGINPYVHAPDAEELAFLRNEQYEAINNKEIPTIYPPLMEMAFYVVTAFSETVVSMKAFFVVIDIGLIVLLAGILGALGFERERVLVYAWCPLPIVEIAASGHNDVLGTILLMGALGAIRPPRSLLAMFLLTLSGLAKLVGAALAPLFLRFTRLNVFVAVPALTLVVVASPYASAGRLGFRGLYEYATRWRGNDSLFHVLFALTGSLDSAKIAVAGLLVLLVVTLVHLRAAPLPAAYVTVGAILALTATVHPWYLLWIVPFLPIFPTPAWMFLTLSVGLSYHAAYLATPGQPWEDVLWVKLLEYVPFYGLLVFSAIPLLRDRGSARRFLGFSLD
jgi:hypothetical protein